MKTDYMDDYAYTRRVDLANAYKDWERDLYLQRIAKGHKALYISLIFENRNTKTGKAYENRETIMKAARLVFNELDKSVTCSGNRSKRIIRDVYEHTGYSGQNVHLHGVLYVEKDVSAMHVRQCWFKALRKARSKVNCLLDIEKSWCNTRKQGKSGIAGVKYNAHEVYGNTDSKLFDLSVHENDLGTHTR